MARLAWIEWGVSLDEYWSETPNIDREEGITYPRMAALSDVHVQAVRLNMFADAMAANAAQSEDPRKSIMKLLDPTPAVVTYEDVPPMLRAPKKRKKD